MADCIDELDELIMSRLGQHESLIWLYRPVHLKKEYPISPAYFDRLVDNPYARAHGDDVVQLFDIFWVEADAAVADAHPDTVGATLVGAMNEVAFEAKPKRVAPERVILSAARDERRQWIAFFEMLSADIWGRYPCGVDHFSGYARGAKRRAPVHVAHANRVGEHNAGAWQEVVEPQLG